MTLYEKIISIYPELEGKIEYFMPGGVINVRNDSDGKESYIDIWEYEKPRPTKEQLNAMD